jgi:putative transposase
MLSAMRLTAAIQLLPTLKQADALKRTLETANAACDFISQVAWSRQTFRQFPIHRLTYQAARETFKLAAQLAVRCIAKVADAYKLSRTTQRTFQRHGALPYDDRILSYNLKGSEVSIWTLDGRQVIPFVCGDHQRTLLTTRRGETDLALVRGKWYLFVTCEVATPEPIDAEGVLGVDLGIVNLATDSDGESFSGQQVERRRQWYQARRQALQKVGTKSAKRRLHQLRGRQRRFQKDTNHHISKRLVAKAGVPSGPTKRRIALEDLSGIRTRARVRGRGQRARHSNWAFSQLRFFISYKAEQAGVQLDLIDPAYTSQRCSACGHAERRNRKNQAEFCCVVCDHQLGADYNAAINIERAAVNRPMVSNPRLVCRVGYPLGAASCRPLGDSC